ncbi:MAG: diguanylate cyclase and metal dependent phosphohydrolase [Solirubrobacterales bacterium]|nr:diguanylate cyclase and metal dependent phosphohydrolase [Solirubrobacterales bacterium]
MVAERRPPPLRTRRYLPLVLLTTALVVVLPAALVSAIVPRGSLLMLAASGLAAVALSMAVATAGAALWKRQPGSRDIVFADLLLWGWLRRCWAERRLSQARSLFDSARKSGPAVSIELVTGLSRLLEARDAYTHGHGQRVARHAARMARAMHLSPVEIAKIQTAAAVHDVGKLYTPREILNNPRRLSDAEYEVAKRHAAWGARMLSAVGDHEIVAMVRHHHERIDGHGYPDGLAGPEIPLGARIIAVADTFDAITSSRAYRAACTQKKALDVLASEAGTQLDPAAVVAFRGRYSARRSVVGLALLTTAPARVLDALQTASQGLVSGVGGVASILPGVGAAGLLALSPGLPQSTIAVRGGHGLPGLSGAAGSIAPPRAAAGPRPARHTTNTKPEMSHRPPIHGAVRTAPAGSGVANASTPRSPSQAMSSAPHEPAGGALPPPPTGVLPTTPPVTGPPPVPPGPPVTGPPVIPPISIPSVTPPTVQAPSVPTTGVTPPIAAPGVSLPAPG